MDNITELAKVLWDYHFLGQPLKYADCLLVLCSHDVRVADYAATLFKKGLAPYMVISGGLAHQTDLLNTGWDRPEAEVFQEIVEKEGVPADKVIIETESHNTGENIKFSRQLLKENNLLPKSFIVLTKPYMERRAFATFKKVWPEPEIIVTSPPIPFEDYPNEKISRDQLVNIMVGDLQRMKEYPKLGFQVSQKIPLKVWQSFEKLVKLGYTKHLI